MKRLFCLVLSIFLLIIFISCAEQQTGSTDNTESETIGTSDTEATPKDTTAVSDVTSESDTSDLTTDTEPVTDTETDTAEITETEAVTTVHEHSYSLSSTVDSTCVKKGSKTYSCACGKSYSEELKLLPHSYSLSSTKNSTCSINGSKTFSCSCGSSYSEVLDLLPHSYTPATCTSPETCSVCGYKNGSMLPHNVVDSVCTICGKEVLCLGITESELIQIAGEPNDIIVESTSVGYVTTYIYCSNMMKLRFYQLHNGKVSAIFSAGSGYIYCHMPTKKSHIPIAYDENMQLISDGNIDILCFTDIIGSKKLVSSWAKLTEFDYGLNTVNDKTVFKGEEVTDYTTQNVLCLYITNYYRMLNGLSPLEYSNEASNASLVHSIDMARNGYFEHTDLNGNRASYRLRNEGIDGVYCGENIQAGYFYINETKTTNVFFITHSWYTSQAHREVMLTPEYKHFGAGFTYYSDSRYEYYSTQVFFRYP